MFISGSEVIARNKNRTLYFSLPWIPKPPCRGDKRLRRVSLLVHLPLSISSHYRPLLITGNICSNSHVRGLQDCVLIWKAEFVTVQANPSAGSVGQAADRSVPQLIPTLSVTAPRLMARRASHAGMTVPPCALRYSHFCTAVCKRYEKARKNPSGV